MHSTLTGQQTRHSLPTTSPGQHATVDMRRIACVVLGGGTGTRLFPLTAHRSKPAVPFGGRYRLIDVPLSNALNSDCSKIYVITQFLSTSLHQHIYSTYHPQSLRNHSIDVLAAEQKPNSTEWFHGTADAVRKNLEYIVDTPADYFLILSGDQLYQMNFQPMFEFALKSDADLVIAALPVDAATAPRMGILKVDPQAAITDFIEKPQDPTILTHFRCPPALLELLGHTQTQQPFYLGSMGIYLFKKEVLLQLLQEDPREDFGKHLIPTKVAQGNVSAYLFDGYWEDIGTVESYYHANIALTRPEPFFNCYDQENPLYMHCQCLPAPKVFDTRIAHSILCEGSIVEAQEIKNSILGPRSIVKPGTIIHDAYLIGNDHYSSPSAAEGKAEPYQIGRNCKIERAIIDSDVHLGDNVHLINKRKLKHFDGDHLYIRDGIIIVTRGARIPDGFVL